MRALSRLLAGSVIGALLSCVAQAAPFAYITNSGSNTVSVVDTATNAVVATVAVGSQPFGVAVNAAGTRAYIGNRGANSVSFIDTVTNTVVATIVVGVDPIGVAVNPAGTRVFVANGGSGTVSVIDAATTAVIATIPVGSQPFGLVANLGGTRVYVANRGASSVSVIDAVANAVVATIPVGVSPTGVAMNAAGTRIYVGSDATMNVSVINAGTGAAIGSLPVGGLPWAVATNASDTQVYARTTANEVWIAEPGTGYTMLWSVRVGAGPGGVSLKPSSTRLVYVVNYGSNSVSLVDTVSQSVATTIAVGDKPIAFGQFIGPAVVAPPATKPDLNQHGLTGSWYEPVTSGQGVEVEVFANPSSGTGSTFVSWFTYDTVAGGAERQRWYTAQGPVVTGQPNALLTIYQNTGGNFNAPPVTNAQAVGTATLSFDTCSSGQLSYIFTDGTGRTGTMPLTRMTQNVTCSTSTPYPTNADFALSGNWYTAATSGQGFTAEVNPNSGAIFSAWYTYMPNGAAAGTAGQRWYTAQGAFAPGMGTIPVTIYETTGGIFDTPTPPGQRTVPVGTGTMAFQSCSAATFSYNFTGGTSSGLLGTITLSRVGPLPQGCAP
jgi:YVTN family beta-propeller protein